MLAISTFAQNIEGLHSFRFRECEIICIKDTAARMPQSLFTDTQSTGQLPAEDSYEASVNVFLLRKGGKTMLVDAGNDPSRGSLQAKLQQAGIRPEDISDIFITHLHPDHVGGLLWKGKALFPNATLHIAKEELEAWKQDDGRRGLAKYLSPYEQRTNTFEYGTELPAGLLPLKRSGHTPGHTIFRMTLADGTQTVFVGDIAHAVALQFPHPTFCARFDAAPKEAVASRLQTLQMEGILFGAHFPFPGAAQGGAILSNAPRWSFDYRKYPSQGPGNK